MISYDLKCAKGHVFEAWFKDSANFDRLKRAGKVVCAHCGNAKIAKAPMAPAVASKKLAPSEEVAQAAAARKMLYQMREAVEKNCEPVGEKFAEEARKMHYGEADKRNIYGQATPTEAQELREEGIEFGELPWAERGDA